MPDLPLVRIEQSAGRAVAVAACRRGGLWSAWWDGEPASVVRRLYEEGLWLGGLHFTLPAALGIEPIFSDEGGAIGCAVHALYHRLRRQESDDA